MIRRPSSPDGDTAALARRRLAALAAQFESGAGSSLQHNADLPDVDEHIGDSRTPAGSDATPAGSTAAANGRHATRAYASEYGRWGLGPQHVTVLALLLAAVVALAAWIVLRSSPHATPVQLTNERSVPSSAAVTSTASDSSSPSAPTPVGGGLVTPAAAPQSTTSLVVDVTGKVRHPGIVELPVGSRVVDALKEAGGARPGVGTRALNLARPLVDGEQIVVGVKVPSVDLLSPTGVPGSTTATPLASVNLNTATEEQLDTLPGIGPVTAAAILQWRSEHGSFTSVDQLLDVSGIGDVTLADIEAYVYV